MPSLLPTHEKTIVLFRLHSELGLEIQSGVRRYLGNRRWRWRRANELDELPKQLTKPVDCILAAISDCESAELIGSLDIPAVNTSGVVDCPAIPYVAIDNEAVGRLAAEHLIEAGFERFLFCGIAGHGYSDARRRGFEAALSALPSAEVNVLDRDLNDWDASIGRTAELLRELPKPLGVFACRDPIAVDVCELSAMAGIHVPGEIAVIGVDNIRTTCEFHSPTVSSIALPWESVGFRAGGVLDDMMAGRTAPAGPVLLEPGRVVRRESSDTVAVSDPIVRRAMRLIQDHVTSGLQVEEIADELGVTRRLLSDRFRDHLGQTPGEYIRRVRLHRSCDALMRSDAPLSQVALDCGFCSQSHFTKAFREFTGHTPAAYRRTHGR
ncbi:MAG: substrate-binding domain-containing protein [Phycisphaerae bacterium]